MKRLMVVALPLALLVVSARPSLAITPDAVREITAQFQSLSQEKAVLDVEFDALKKEAADIDWVRSSLDNQHATLTAERQAWNAQVAALNSDGEAAERVYKRWVDECLSHQFILPDEQAAYDDCRARQTRGQSTARDLEARQQQLQRDDGSLSQREWLLQQAAAEHEQRRKNGLARAEAFGEKAGNWMRRANAFAPLFRQLMEAARQSRGCADIEIPNDLDAIFTHDLNRPMERAARCLQNVFDGAR